MSRPLLILCTLFFGAACATDAKDPAGGTDTEPADSGATEAPELTFSTRTLPAGEAHVLYSAVLEVQDATGPVTYAVASGHLPEGLVLNPTGTLSGIPVSPGSFSFSIRATDSDGVSGEQDLALDVARPGFLLQCGDTVDGTFTERGLTGDGWDIQWDNEAGWAHYLVQLPPESTRLVTLQLAALAYPSLFVGNPGVPTDARSTWYHDWADGVGVVSYDIHGDTTPGLDDYRAAGGPISVYFASDTSETDWSFTVSCSDAPVLDGLYAYPVELGAPLVFNANAVGDNFGLTWSVDGALPEWAVLDPVTGRIEGVAEEAGAYEFTIVAETDTGERTEAQAGFAVYAPVELGCGETTTLSFEESYYDGAFAFYYDPRGYAVVHTVPSETTSSVTYSVWGPEGEAAVVRPASSTPFYGSVGSRSFESPRGAWITVGPGAEYPLPQHLSSDGVVALVVEAHDTSEDFEVTVDCDEGAMLARNGLPVLAGGEAESHVLDTVGGQAPFTWSATGLPDGVSLSADGTLSTTGAAAEGQYAVVLEVEDSLGTVAVREHTLHVGAGSACEGAVRLHCGESITPSISSDGGALCIVGDHDHHRQLVLETAVPSSGFFVDLYLGPPGGALADARGRDAVNLDAVYYGDVSHTVLREGADPDLDRWRDGVLWVGLDTYYEEEPTFTLTCEE